MRQLSLAYFQTYGITEDFTGVRKGTGSSVSGYRLDPFPFIPRIAYAVTLLHRNHELPAELSGP